MTAPSEMLERAESAAADAFFKVTKGRMYLRGETKKAVTRAVIEAIREPLTILRDAAQYGYETAPTFQKSWKCAIQQIDQILAEKSPPRE